ncbi:MAG: hypothetical protein CMP56_01505 [Flavobacteriales bacterium]|nr:hypothetical protein [Flavobacteriales bacterium]
MTLLDVKNLSILKAGKPLINKASISILRGESVGLFGRSGSGKSVFSLFLLGLLSSDVFNVSAGSAMFYGGDDGFSLLSTKEEGWNIFRRSSVSMIFQDPSVALNPTIICGKQVEESLCVAVEKKRSCIRLFSEVGLKNPEKTYSAFPHELSGGQKQRVVIAIALASNPKLLIADEPTTSLDPSVQKSVLDLILKIKKTRSIGVLLISHDLALVRYFCDKIYVFKNCSFYESSLSVAKKHLSKKEAVYTDIKKRVFEKKQILGLDGFLLKNVNKKNNLFNLKNISVSFLNKSRVFYALKNISLQIKFGDCVGVVGGSGSGKTTLGRVLCGLESSYSGSFSFPKKTDFLKKSVQMVYQDPFSSFNPKYTVEDSLKEIISLYKTDFSPKSLFKTVGLNPNFLLRFPHELSGGQKQRVSIARVLASKPSVIVFDEALSALDIETQYSLLKLIRLINVSFNISVVFISHNIDSVYYLCNRIIVLNSGRIDDDFSSLNLFSKKRTNYTKEIIKNSLL